MEVTFSNSIKQSFFLFEASLVIWVQ